MYQNEELGLNPNCSSRKTWLQTAVSWTQKQTILLSLETHVQCLFHIVHVMSIFLNAQNAKLKFGNQVLQNYVMEMGIRDCKYSSMQLINHIFVDIETSDKKQYSSPTWKLNHAVWVQFRLHQGPGSTSCFISPKYETRLGSNIRYFSAFLVQKKCKCLN